MKVTILGWYGTETLGDRAILYGLLNILQDIDEEVHIKIGSIYPFFTERSLFEDVEFINLSAPSAVIEIFDVKNKSLLKNNIIESEIVAMGGGPIMDLQELGIIKYGFRVARKNGVKTAILGCGIGPLKIEKHQNVALDIINNSDLVIFRDKISISNINRIAERYNVAIKPVLHHTHDPAVAAVHIFQSNCNKDRERNVYAAANFRKFPQFVYDVVDMDLLDDFIVKMVSKMADEYDSVVLFPMHTFDIGGDDRDYLNKVKLLANNEGISVVNKPLNLWSLFELISSAELCVGMRYHSVVFQTLLNGNNYIVDYTDKMAGKIPGFIEMIDGREFYDNRYINIQEDSLTLDRINLHVEGKMECSQNIYSECKDVFIKEIKTLIH